MVKLRIFVFAIAFLCTFSSVAGVSYARADDSAAADSAGTEDDTSLLDRADYDPNYKQWERAHSHYAYGIRAAYDNIPPADSAMGNIIQIYGEWILPFQKMGLFSIGGHFASFALKSSGNSDVGSASVPYTYSNIMGGAQFRYELEWTTNQLIVPTATVDADFYHIGLSSGSTSGVTAGFGVGLMLNLSILDAVTAKEAYESLGMTRAYLTIEFHPMSISNSDLSVSGNLFYAGLRLEFD